MDLPHEIGAALAPFAPLVSDRPWRHAHLLAVGAPRAAGRRTVASALRSLGRAGASRFTTPHRVLNRDAGSCRAAGQVLLGLIRAALPGDAPLVLAADDAIGRRHGRRIRAQGGSRGPVRSSRKHPVKCSGLKWVVLTVLVPAPRSRRVGASPALSAWSWPEGQGPRRGHKSSLDGARQLALRVRRGGPQRELILVLDGGFAAVALASDCRRQRSARVGRLRGDAAVSDRPSEPPPGRRGPEPTKGARPPGPKRRAADPTTVWEAVAVDGSGGRRRAMRVVTGTGVGHTPHLAPVAIRWVLARDPQGEHRDAASLRTDEQVTPEQVLGPVVQRRSVEVTFEEARAHLGVETQRQWSDRATARTPPVRLGLSSVMTWPALRGHEQGTLTAAGSAWYAKEAPTFFDGLAAVRERIWRGRILCGSCGGDQVGQLPEPLLEAVIHGLSRAT